MPITVGTVTVLTMAGRPAEPAPLIEATDRAGRDGSELRDLGLREIASQLQTIQTAADSAAAATAEAANRALEGTIVTIVDAFGTSHTNCLIQQAACQLRAVVKPSSTTTHTRAIFTTWTVKKLYAAP